MVALKKTEVVQFAKAENNMFTFTFIDPTGWKGFGMNNIRPLLELPFSEVLINFMTILLYVLLMMDAKRSKIPSLNYLVQIKYKTNGKS